jgi:ribosomal-protein-alanine N-acetyltransferase
MIIASDNITVRPMRAEDIERITAIEVEVTPAPWSRAQFGDSLERSLVNSLERSLDSLERTQNKSQNQINCLVICQQQFHLKQSGEKQSSQVLGYLILSTLIDQTEVLNIAIDPICQGQRLGSRLLEFGLQLLPDTVEAVLLEVRVSNFAAIRLYLNHGFVEVGRRRDYYKTEYGREDAILMTLQRFSEQTP